MSEQAEGYRAGWSAAEVRALRKHLGASQDRLAEEMGVRQQTVSEWETGRHLPRGASLRLLGMIAERAGFEYVPQSLARAVERPGEE